VAYDIAGQGIANASSMVEAIRLAARMAEVRKETQISKSRVQKEKKSL
jgi:hypothetical protein